MNSVTPAPSSDLIPYAKPQPWGMVGDMMIGAALSADERLWAPVGQDSWSRPLHLNVSAGYYVHLLRVRRSGLLQRHRHANEHQVDLAAQEVIHRRCRTFVRHVQQIDACLGLEQGAHEV